MNLVEQILYEAKASEFIKNQTYYHGTYSTEAYENIIKNGLQIPDKELLAKKYLYNASYIPVSKGVYLTKDINNAAKYIVPVDQYQKEKFGYIFEFPGTSFSNVLPDEDELSMLAAKHLRKPTQFKFFNDILKKLSKAQLNVLKDDDYDLFPKVGKAILKLLTDEQILLLLDKFENIVSTEPLKPTKVYIFKIPPGLFMEPKLIKTKQLHENKLNKTVQKSDIKIIADYVNYNDYITGMENILVPDNLKYSGIGYRVISCSKETLKNILNGATIKLKPQKVLSFSKTLKGLTRAFYNLEADDPGKYNYGIIIKTRITKENCIVDITKFAKQYPGAIYTSGYSNYLEEEEVICKGFLDKISIKDLDGYIEKSEPRKIKESVDRSLFKKILQEVIKHIKVKSSNVKSIGYEPKDKTLEVKFLDGSTYAYYDVPQVVFNKFKTASSKGKYVWRKLRDIYDYERL